MRDLVMWLGLLVVVGGVVGYFVQPDLGMDIEQMYYLYGAGGGLLLVFIGLGIPRKL